MDDKKFQLLFYAVRLAHPHITVTARLPLAISRLETGNWKANSFVGYNNFFGMTAPNARETTAINKGSNKVAVFSSVMDSMTDFFLWCDNWQIKSDADLQKFVDDLRYNKNPKYPATVQGIVSQLAAADEYLNPALFNPIMVGGVAVLAVGGIAAAVAAVRS